MIRKNSALLLLATLVLFIVSLGSAVPTSGIREEMKRTYVPEFEHTELFMKYAGSMGAYHSPHELHTLMAMLLTEFPEVIRSVDVGKTYMNRTIHGFVLGLNLTGNGTDWEQQALARPAILLNGAHHARELTSISMCSYTMLRLLFDYVHNDEQVMQLLQDSALFFIPVVNVDGFEAMANAYNKTQQTLLIRKNRHQYPAQKNCAATEIGVDLNRNYPYMFGLDDEGSTGEENVCGETYRGPSPLSEPETKAVADFVTKWTNLKVVINFHAFGNLFIYPFNYDTRQNAELYDKFPLAANFYNHLWTDGGVPSGSVKGNGKTTIKYTANGEASDYFLNTKGLYSISPELGT